MPYGYGVEPGEIGGGEKKLFGCGGTKEGQEGDGGETYQSDGTAHPQRECFLAAESGLLWPSQQCLWRKPSCNYIVVDLPPLTHAVGIKKRMVFHSSSPGICRHPS